VQVIMRGLMAGTETAPASLDAAKLQVFPPPGQATQVGASHLEKNLEKPTLPATTAKSL
jgi:hypothetical protein